MSIITKAVDDAVEEVAGLLAPKPSGKPGDPAKLAILCGAGVSANSGIPLVKALKERLLSGSFMTPEDLSDLSDPKKTPTPFEAFMTPEDLSDLSDPEKTPTPFEAFFGEALHRAGNAKQSLLRIFAFGEPNTNHYLCARLLLSRLADIYTTNFDLMFEQAMQGEEYRPVRCEPDMEEYLREVSPGAARGDKPSLIKLHGSVDMPESIVATIESLLSPQAMGVRIDLLRHLFDTGLHSAVLVLGYSWSDDFDVNKVLRTLGGSAKRIVYVDHPKDVGASGAPAPPVSERLQRTLGAFDVMRVACRTESFVEELWKRVFGADSYSDNHKDFRAKTPQNLKEWASGIDFRPLQYLPHWQFAQVGRYRDAIRYWERDRAFAVKSGDLGLEARAYSNLGSLYDIIGDSNTAVGVLKKGLRIYRDLGDHRDAAAVQINLAEVYRHLHRYPEAEDSLRRCLDLVRDDDGALKLRQGAYNGLGAVSKELGDLTSYAGDVVSGRELLVKAQAHYQTALALANERVDHEAQLRLWNNLGGVAESMGDHQAAVGFYTHSIGAAGRMADKPAEGTARNNLAAVHLRLGRTEEAREGFQQALKIAIETGDKELEESATSFLSTLNSQQSANGSTDGGRHLDLSRGETRAAGRPSAERKRWLQDRPDRPRASDGAEGTRSLQRDDEASSRAANHVAAALATVHDLITKPRG